MKIRQHTNAPNREIDDRHVLSVSAGISSCFKTQPRLFKMKLWLLALLCGLAVTGTAQDSIESVNALYMNNLANDQYNAQIHISQMLQKLREQQAHSSSYSSRSTQGHGKLRLDQFSHALDVQLEDKLGTFDLLSVVVAKDLREAINPANTGAENTPGTNRRKLAILNVTAVPTLASWYGLPPNTNSDFDLKNTNILNQFSNAGIKYLLLTTLEDMDENHIDGPSVTRSIEYLNGRMTGWYCWVG